MKNEIMGNRKAIDVAHYMLSSKGVVFTPMKLIKMVYIAHGWFMAFHGEDNPLIDEKVQAWKYGPVIPSVFHEFKVYESSRIDPVTLNGKLKQLFNQQEKSILDEVVDSYGSFSGTALSYMTHCQGTPWSKHYDKSYSKEIPNQDICNHYREKLEKYGQGKA